MEQRRVEPVRGGHMKLTVIGCGDAFGSGGRLQTCFHVDIGGTCVLIDCGATALIGLNKAGLDPNKVEAIQISHLHGDHFSGLVWWLLHAVHVGKRRAPLVVAGPAGIEQRLRQAAEVLFPGSMDKPPPFELNFIEQAAGQHYAVGPLQVTPFEVSHPSGAASHALRLEGGGRTLAFSGDTEWVQALVPCSDGADLFLCECYAFEQPTRYHMSWQVLSRQLPRIRARRVVLTHMSPDMLAAVDEARRAGVSVAEDGMVIDV